MGTDCGATSGGLDDGAIALPGQARDGGGTVVEFAEIVVPCAIRRPNRPGMKAAGATSPDDLERVLAIAESNCSLTVWPRFFATCCPWPV